jgi:TonB-linked SusC/RagA family outer membrane protein
MNGSINNTNNNNYLTETTLSYRKRFSKDQIIDAVGGFSYQRGKSFGNGFSSIKVPQALESFGINALGAGTNATNWRYGTTQNQLYSFFGRVNYSLMERYLFTATGRNDGSSKFAKGNQWGFFPSAAFAWRFTQERFFKKKSILSDGKLKISYGFVGNNKVSDYASLYQMALTGNSGYFIDGTYIPGSIPYFYGNKDITWEKTGELNIGTSLSFFNEKILIDIDYYRKETRNSLLNITLPSIAGYANGSNSQYQNAATITNRGLEVTITTVNIQKKKFSWTSSFNISFNKNKIVEFYRGTDIRQIGWNLNQGATAWVAKEGYPISQFFGNKWAGVYQYADFNQLANGTYVLKPGVPTYPNITGQVQPGDAKYADLNGDGVIDENDRTIIGSALPIHTGGFSNNFTLNNRFRLNLFFQWSYGNQNLNANQLVFNQTGNYYANSNQFAEYANRWTPTNPSNDIPRASPRTSGTDIDGNTRVSSRLVEDGSYLRFKTVSFSYTLPDKYLKRFSIYSASLFIQIQNLLTITKYKGYDPEVSTYRAANPANLPSGVTGNTLGGVGYIYVQPSSGAAALAQGYDYVPYPRSRTFTIGANITF